MTVAMFDSRCADCDGQIKSGTEITSSNAGWVHVVCPPARFDLQRPICQACFTEISVNGACMCGAVS